MVPGLLNPLDTPHHMRAEENCQFREGVTLNRPVKPGQGSLVDCGLFKVDKSFLMPWFQFFSFLVDWF